MKILIIADPERKDIIEYLSKDIENSYVLLYRIVKDEEDKNLHSFISEEIYWGDYRTPQALLDQVKPDKIVLLEIIDLYQIGIICSAKKNGITTFFLEHGAAGDANTAFQNSLRGVPPSKKFIKIVKGILKLKKAIKSRVFFYSTIFKYGIWEWDFLTLPFRLALDRPNNVLRGSKTVHRLPDYAITFNQANTNEFKLWHPVPDSNVIKSGIPFFDKYFKNNYENKNYILFIDHPYLEQKMLGWTSQFHEEIFNQLSQLATENKKKLVIKLHPVSDRSIWEGYIKSSLAEVELEQFNTPIDLYLEADIILGYSSSLITGILCARKNVVLVGWHPTPHIFGADFSKYKICHLSMDLKNVKNDFIFWSQNNLAVSNETDYQKYMETFNLPFDGKASERVINSFKLTNK